VLTVESGLRGRRGVANGGGSGGRGLGVVHLDVLRHRGVADEVAGVDTGCRWGVAEQTLKPCGFILFFIFAFFIYGSDFHYFHRPKICNYKIHTDQLI
jgi:hypothetical protein